MVDLRDVGYHDVPLSVMEQACASDSERLHGDPLALLDAERKFPHCNQVLALPNPPPPLLPMKKMMKNLATLNKAQKKKRVVVKKEKMKRMMMMMMMMLSPIPMMISLTKRI